MSSSAAAKSSLKEAMPKASFKEFAARYNAAWNAHDVPAIMAMHVDDTSYQRHGIPIMNGPTHKGMRAPSECRYFRL